MMTKTVGLLALATIATMLAACGDDGGSDPATMLDFEDVALGSDGALTGATAAPAIEVGGVLFYSVYDSEFELSSGFAISSQSDTTTAGFMNPLSAFPGSGASGSSQFAVWNPPFGSEDPAIEFPRDVSPVSVEVANTTYAALSMEMGDAFAKQHSAADMDFFEVIFTGVAEDGSTTGRVEHYLSDFLDGEEPGIQRGWARVSLAALGSVRSIAITFESSDVGSFGINTPLYVAIDELAFR